MTLYETSHDGMPGTSKDDWPEYIGAFSMKFMENCIEKHLGLLVQSVYKLLNLG